MTIGRAIHWLDPEPAQEALDRVVKPGGRIFVCHASSADDGRNPWLQAFMQVRNRWRTERPAFDRDRFRPRILRPAPDDQGRDGRDDHGRAPR